MSDDLNPYRAPDFTDDSARPVQSELSTAYLIQQRIVACVMIVHGVMCLLWSLLWIGMMVFAIVQNDEDSVSVAIVFGVMAAGALLPGVLQILAGIANFWLRGYMLGILALLSGVTTIFTCYCFFTGTPLLVYGLVIYLNPMTKRAFQLAALGHSWNDLLRMAAVKRY